MTNTRDPPARVKSHKTQRGAHRPATQHARRAQPRRAAVVQRLRLQPVERKVALVVDERADELKHVFPGGRSAIPEQLMLPWGTGEGFLGDVRIGAHHYRREDLKVETRGGIGACILCSSSRHSRHDQTTASSCPHCTLLFVAQ